MHPLGNWWKSVKHSVAWRLLEVAKNGDYHDRVKAVHQLARIDHLKGVISNRIYLARIRFSHFFYLCLTHRLGLSAFGTNV